MRFDRQSLQFRLAWRLAVVFALATVIFVIDVFLEARETARSPDAWTPEDQTETLAQLERGEVSTYVV